MFIFVVEIHYNVLNFKKTKKRLVSLELKKIMIKNIKILCRMLLRGVNYTVKVLIYCRYT